MFAWFLYLGGQGLHHLWIVTSWKEDLEWVGWRGALWGSQCCRACLGQTRLQHTPAVAEKMKYRSKANREDGDRRNSCHSSTRGATAEPGTSGELSQKQGEKTACSCPFVRAEHEAGSTAGQEGLQESWQDRAELGPIEVLVLAGRRGQGQLSPAGPRLYSELQLPS